MPSIADLEYAYLGNQGATGTLADRRSQIYGNQFAYFSALSGLTPANLYSLADHQYAYYSAGGRAGSLADVKQGFWAAALGL